MQGLHQQQQQLASLLSVALPKKDASPSASKPAENEESARLSAITSLHRAILYPPNSLLVAHSASFLSQGISQLLPDKSYAIRQSAATAYGALCAVVCSIPLATTGRQNHVLLGAMVDRFIGWALPLLSIVTAGDGTTELALDSLREFLNVGDVNGIERYALPILKACQQLLEDERTSLSLLHRLLGIVTLISLKFLRCFQPHFLDIVDLLLGWALVPDLVEADRRVIMDCFLQFQKHWVGNLQFSLGLLSKFLGDMESLLQDNALGTEQQFGRLLALLSCFSTVLQSTASGLLELNLLEQITEPLSKMLPRLLTCLSIIGRRFGWSKWSGDLWRCLTLLAEILRENFSDFYPLAVDTLFQSLEKYEETSFGGAGKSNSSQVHGVLRTNLQLLSLQKLGLLPSSVEKIMHFGSPISQLRLHPNHVVTASSAATYVFLLQHGNNEVVEQTMVSLLAELEILKRMIEKTLPPVDDFQENDSRTYSNFELFALVKFDLKVLLTCVSLGGSDSLLGKSDMAILHLKRSDMLIDFVTKNLNPHEYPIVASVELQASVMVMLERLSKIEFLSKCSTCTESSSVDVTTVKNLIDVSALNLHSALMEYFRKYGRVLVKSLHVSAPLAIKLISLKWVQGLCENIIVLSSSNSYFFRSFVHFSALGNVIDSILVTASDKEPKVRSHVTSVLELLVKARLIHPINFYSVVQTVLEKLGDPDNNIKNTFTGLLSHLMLDMIYSCGLCDYGPSIEYGPGLLRVNSSVLHWKQVFALKQLPQKLQAQQLVSVLSYISQRWKVPLSSWIQRLIHTCQKSEDLQPSQSQDTEELGTSGSWLDIKVDEDFLENVCSANVLAAAWWAMQEAARYCIATRLRTNLGGPSQTFAALERMLLDISHVLQLDSEQNDGSLSLINSSGAHLLPMRLLLDFVEALKKNVYNAYEGSAILPSVSRPSSLFFRANKKVCEEWFSRICEPMLNAGLALQCPHATIEYCTLRLHDLNNAVASNLTEKFRVQILENLQNIKTRFLGDILRVLRHMALALCRCHEPEALIGLQMWASQKFSLLLDEETHSKNHSGDSGHLVWITGLVYQAKGEYERSAAYFTHLLQIEESLSSMGSDGVQFAVARIIESYSAVSDWKSLESWLLELQTLRAKHSGKSYSGALTAAGNDVNAIHALSHFDRSDFSAAWACLDLTPKSSGELTLDPKLALQRSEQMLLQAMLLQVEGKEERLLHDVQKAKLMLEEILSVLPLDGVEEAALCATQLHCILAFEDAFNAKDSQERSKQLDSLVNPYVKMVHCPVEIARQDCNLWLKVLRVYRTISPSSPTTLNLCMNMSRLARKQKNLMLAHRLNGYLGEHVHRCSVDKFRDFQISNLEYEKILLMHAEDKYEDAFTNLWSYVRPCMVSSASFVPNADETILKAKACLKLSDWLHDHEESCLEVIAPRIQEDFNRANFSYIDKGTVSTSDKKSIRAIADKISGTSIKLSTNICPSMGKTWMSYGSWCFNQARNYLLNPHDSDSALQSCSFSSFLESEVQPGTFKLNQDELDRVNTVMSQMFIGLGGNSLLEDKGGDENVKGIASENSGNDHRFKALVKQVVNIIESTAVAPGSENSSSECLSTTVASRIRICFLPSNLRAEDTDFVVDQLIEIWRSLRRRRVNLFGHAARGFIQYLSYSSSMICNGEMVGSCYKSLKTGSYTLKATLYVLNILLNYGVELHDILEPSLSTVPLWPWQEVTPQLFARLSSHPEQLVRNQLQGLLMMLGKRSPWSIVYPTLLDANEANPSEELLQILGCLREQHPRLIQDVQLLINELGNVTVLWEELWLSTLQDIHADVMRRIHVLREEAARIAGNATLSQMEKSKINAAKYSAMMAPIFVTLERRLASTSRKPKTPHEMWFHQQYTEQLKSAILAFKTPPKSAYAITDVWRPFDSIAASLASCQRKSSVSLSEVAPQLALLSSSDVPMPGLEKQIIASESDSGTTDAQGIVTISSFLDQVTILSTKTKPKKINIMGSDGQKYTYLLKGREDLRLDARIMQLLQAINSLLQTSQATRGHLIGARYYSVTPISGRAGLIQWVHNVTSIYSVFKCWQTRTQLAQQSANGDTKDAAPSVPRPSDMFYGKIIPALKEQGIKRVISRRDWPHDVKRKVLVDLMKEVPRQLLYQELWCASEGFKAFSSKLKRYSGSVAAMSMVGHILGLGDRHLDNILVDFYSGDVVHIDYNVCFDKGQRLKIPEIVPFRLTQMIEAALGLTGVEGTFRSNCEAVIGVMRKNKDILLMLLEVFVWDPLVEWTRGDFHDDAAIGGEERKGMELAVSLSLFASRVQEIRVPLEEHRDVLLSTLPAIESSLEKFADVLSKYELVSVLFHRADQERSNLILHETSAKSVVAEATSNAEKIRGSFENQAREYSQAKAIVTEKAKEATNWIEQHIRVLDAVRGDLIFEANAWIKLSAIGEALSLKSAVLVAGVPLSVVPEPTQVHCHDVDREVSQLVAELDHGVAAALGSLQVYSLALRRVLPLSYHTTSIFNGWAQVLQLCSNVISSDTISLARRHAAELVSNTWNKGHASIQNVYDDLCLKVDKYTVDVERLKGEHFELVNSIGSETETKAKERLLSSFMKYIQSEDGTYLPVSSGQFSLNSTMDARYQRELTEKKEKALLVLNLAVVSFYKEVHDRVLSLGSNTRANSLSDLSMLFGELEAQVEKCILLSSFLNEISQISGFESLHPLVYSDDQQQGPGEMFPSIFKRNLHSCTTLVDQMTEVVLQDVVRAAISHNSEFMDMLGSISQVRGTIDTALEQLLEVELERASLVELEQNYFVKVGLITERQLALKEAAMKSRDHLSWEEAEELASQEEACRVQLDQLHQSWNQREKRTYYLMKRESEIKSVLLSCEHHFETLVKAEDDVDLNVPRSKGLLARLVKPFSELESIDEFSSAQRDGFTFADVSFNIADFINSGHSISENVWKLCGLVNRHAFFIWKVFVVDSFVDSCIQDIAASVDQSLGFDQLLIVVRRKQVTQLEKNIASYLKARFLPSMGSWLEKEIEQRKQMKGVTKESTIDFARKDIGAVKKVQLMLEEYSNAHETARAAKSAAFLMEKQVKEFKEGICRTILELVQMEWMHDASMSPSQNSRALLQKHISADDDLHAISNLSRLKVLESLQSSAARIAQTLEGLQSVERASLTAEGQLERAMSWACGVPTSTAVGQSSSKASGIPPEFHQHLMRRQQLIWDCREKASDIIKICMSVLEFEASRDGILWVPGEVLPPRAGGDDRAWQQAYFNAVSRLDVSYHSFSRIEQEWKMAQSSIEASSSSLYSATNELSIASLKAKTASDELQITVLAMRDCAYEVSVALSAFSRISKSHTALTSECGSMLEEVLAITDDLHDVHSLGKEAAIMHRSLMEDLSKANSILLPLESVMSKDVTAMTDAIARERETKMEISPIHGQAIYQSYCSRIREATQTFKPLLPPLIKSAEELFSLLTRLARAASLHAGNLHKAFEVEESQKENSQELDISKADSDGNGLSLDGETGDQSTSNEDPQGILGISGLSLQDKGWISPPDSICSSSSESGLSSTETSLPDSSIDPTEEMSQSKLLEVKDSAVVVSGVSHEEESTVQNVDESAVQNLDSLQQENIELKSGGKDENDEVPSTSRPTNGRVIRGKNTYAMSVLRRVEMKLEGRDISDSREVSISDQVDYLLKQASSLDNLCNMYEGWTPWI